MNSLGDLVATLQGHISSLGAQVKQNNNETGAAGSIPLTSSSTTLVGTQTQRSEVSAKVGSDETKRLPRLCHTLPAVQPADTTAGPALGNIFYGPTSPEFGLNIAQMKLRTGGSSQPSLNSGHLDSVDDSPTDDEDINNKAEHTLSQSETPNMSISQRLLQFQESLSVREAVQALLVYKEVVGMYHPILDVDMLVQLAKHWYTWPSRHHPPWLSAVDEYNMLVVNLAISISLCIDSTALGAEQAELRDKIYSSCLELVNAKIVGQNPDIKNAIVLLLVVSALFPFPGLVSSIQ